MYMVKGSSLAWLVVMPSIEKIETIGHPYVRVLVDVNKTVTFEVLGKTVQEFKIENAESTEKLLEILITFNSETAYR